MRHIICFGNPLHGDDGFGYAVWQHLHGLKLPEGVKVFAAGTAGLNALPLFRDCEEVLIVDTLSPGEHPGRLHHLSPAQVETGHTVVGHGSGVANLLTAAIALSDHLPRIRIVAAEATGMTLFQPNLSPAMTRAVEAAATWLKGYIRDPAHAWNEETR